MNNFSSCFYLKGSYKAKKTTLTEEGYNVKKIKDKVYYFDTTEQTYKELTIPIFESILKVLLEKMRFLSEGSQ